VIFAAETYSGPNGRPLCAVPTFGRPIDQTIGIGILLGAPPNVEGYFSDQKITELVRCIATNSPRLLKWTDCHQKLVLKYLSDIQKPL
jgi:hypothetical protein